MTKPIILDNGTRVHLVPFSGTEAATILVLFKIGSRYESRPINGASHYIEHLMFKGTKRRPTTLAISRALDAVGAEYNAYTGKDVTGYYVKASSEHLPLAIDLLHDMLFHSKFDQTEMDRERSVIIEEINMYRDNPMMHVGDLLEEAMFDGSTLGWEIAGTHQTMRTMTRDAVVAFRDAYYDPSRMVITVAGKIDAGTLKLVKKTFGKVKPRAKAGKEFKPFSGLASSKLPRTRVQFKKTEQIHVAFGYPSYKLDDKRVPAAVLLSLILGGTMSSRLFIAVRERRGLAYFVRASQSSYEDVGMFTIQSGLDRSRLPLAMKTIMSEIRRITRDGVTARELRDAQDHVRGKLLLKLEDSSERADWFAKQELFLGRAKTPAERMREINAVTRAQVRQAAKEILNGRRLSVAAIGPFKDGKAFLKAAGL